MRRRRLALAGLLAAVVIAIVVGAVLPGGSGRSSTEVATTPESPPAAGPPAAGAAGPPAQPPPAGEQFGASVNRLFNDHAYPLAQISARLHDLRQAGVTVARTDALWEAAEPAPPVQGVHHYDWTFDDVIATSLAINGLRWLAILDYTAPWDVSVPGQDHSAPRSSSDFAAFAAAFARRYGTGGAFWRAHPMLSAEPVETFEVWNEPDLMEFWIPAPDAAGYAELYLHTRDAVAAADPSARVIVGGLTNPRGFLPAMLRSQPGMRGHVDGVAIHPYGANPHAVLESVRGARLTLNGLGMGTVPLYVTEVGWTTSPPGALDYAPPSVRPGYIQTTLANLGHSDCGIAATVVYTWVTPERDPANPQDWFGLQPPAGGSTADTDAFAAGLHDAATPSPSLSFCAT